MLSTAADAASRGDLAALEQALSTTPAVVHARADDGDTLLGLALLYAKTEMGDVLAAPPVPDNLRHAAALGREALVALGADVNASPFRGTPLLWAVYPDAVEAVRWLLDHGADPDLRHDFGGEGHGQDAVAMHLAAQFGALRSLRLLLDRGADPHVVDGRDGGTPLEWAEHGGADEAARLLRERG